MITRTLQRWAPAHPSRRALGQAEDVAVRIAVVDVDGRPVKGARVSVRLPGSVPEVGETAGDGTFVVRFAGGHPGSDRVEVEVEKDGYVVVRSTTMDEGIRGTIFVQLPVCLPQPILTGVELGSLAAGLALAAAGLYWKLKPAELIGEVLIGAAAFTAIYRHSCL